ncbi:MAG: F0F1 ATP synthase subunit alpha [Candidatus Omnitrophota bacterium]
MQTQSYPFRIKELGRVKEVRKFIVKIEGFPSCMNGQLVSFPGGTKGLVMGFNEREALAIILGYEGSVRIGDIVEAQSQAFTVPVNDSLPGRIITALGKPCDEKGPIAVSGFLRLAANADSLTAHTSYCPVFTEAPSAMERSDVHEQLETGVKMVDMFVPLAKGQRILIFGDRMSGKTSLATDAIINQKDKDVVCVYCSIGKSYFSLLRVVQLLKKHRALDYTVVVAAGAASSCGEQYLAPYTATAVAEYFMNKGKDVLLVMDDLTKHAWAYRQLSLLLERPPGREACPGDIYYIHAQLLERSGKLIDEKGGGSITSLVLADTLQGDISSYIPSNFVSMLDGQIYLSTTLFGDGFKPAIDFGLSISIMGGKIQHPAIKEFTQRIRIEYAQYRELLRLMKLKSTLSSEAEAKIKRGETITELLKQQRSSPVSQAEQIILLYALEKGMLDKLSSQQLKTFKNDFFSFVQKEEPEIVRLLEERQPLDNKSAALIEKVLQDFFVQIAVSFKIQPQPAQAIPVGV